MTDQFHQRRDLRIGHGDTEALHRRAEFAAFAGDAEVAVDRDLEAGPRAGAVDLRHRRHRAVAQRPQRRAHDLGVGRCLSWRVPLPREFRHIRAGAEGRPRAPDNHAADGAIASNLDHDRGQPLPHRLVEGVQPLRTVEREGSDVALAGQQHGVGHGEGLGIRL